MLQICCEGVRAATAPQPKGRPITKNEPALYAENHGDESGKQSVTCCTLQAYLPHTDDDNDCFPQLAVEIQALFQLSLR
jgi:hypothetical protein